MKPVASGCDEIDGQLRNEDALLLQQHASIMLPYRQVNPYAFAPPVSPHIAASQAGVEIEFEQIIRQYRQLKNKLR